MNLSTGLRQSILLHAGFGVLILSVYLFAPKMRVAKRFQVQLREAQVIKKQPESQPVINVGQQTKPVATAQPVFGQPNKTLSKDQAKGVELKAGNTLAKAVDDIKIRPEDANALPVPTDEYLVTQMPKLRNEYRIPYPPEAKAKSIEGVVVMEVLIDEVGRVRTAQLVEGPGYGLNEAAMTAIYNFEFTPAQVDGRPVAVKIRWGYRFVLN